MSELPQSWSSAPIANLFSKVVDGSHNPPAGVSDGVPMLSARNIYNGSIEFDEFRRIPNAAFEIEDKRTRIRAGDVLLTIVGTIGRAAVVTESTGPLALQRSVAVLTPRLSNPRFWMYQLQAPHVQRALADRARGTAQKGVYLGTLGKLELRIAPAPEQDRLVAEIEKQFTRLDAAVAATKRVQANLKRYRASVLKAACEGRLVPTEAELARKEGRSYEPASELLKRILAERRAKWEADQLQKMIAADKPPKNDQWKERYKKPEPPNTSISTELPEGWIWATADQCTSLITDGEHITPERSDSGVLLLSARNVLNGRLSLKDVDYVPERVYEQLRRRLEIVPGDVLLSCSGSVGRSSVAPPALKFALVRSVAVLRPVIILGTFLSLALRSPLLQDQIRTKSTQTAQANIFQGKIQTLIVPIPPLGEQVRIMEAAERQLSNLDDVQVTSELAMARSSTLRQSVLARAFSGKLVSQDSNDEPASVLLERIRAERAALAANNGNQRATPEAGIGNGQRRRRITRLAHRVSGGKGVEK